MTDPTAAPEHVHGHYEHGHGAGENEPTPTEFGLSLIGDGTGLAAILMSFGHLRWQFIPDLAADLGNALVQAAHQARQYNASHAQKLHPANGPGLTLPGEHAGGVRASGLVIP